MRFPYRQFRARHPIPSLGGRASRPRPVVRVTLIGPLGSYLEDCLLDTGADDTVFPESVAAKIGLDLAGAPTGDASGVGVSPATLRYARATLRLTDGREFREWIAQVGFTSTHLKQPLLGFAGCLQFFTATFRGDQEEVELVVNGLYPGT
jgi:hypothetical protein